MAEQNVWICVYHGDKSDDATVASTRALALKLGVEAVKLHWEEVTHATVRQTLREHLARGEYERVIEVWNAYVAKNYIDVYGPQNLVNEDFNNGNFPEEPTP